jgi:type I site-specific restriction-modification system R (restriction) subunit
MRGAAPMQAPARVNRTYRNKQDGLLVGYAPLTENLYAALAEYTPSDQKTTRHRRHDDPRRLRLASQALGARSEDIHQHRSRHR